MRKRRGPYLEDPAVLKINRESRAMALLRYTRRDALYLKYWEMRDDVKYCSYINFKLDIAFFYDFDQFELLAGPDDDIGCQFFSEAEMGKIERLWIVHEGVVNLGRDLATWLDHWLPRFMKLKWMIVEVKNLKKCRGIAAPWRCLFHGRGTLQDVREIGLDKLYRLQESLGERGVKWDVPLLEVGDGYSLNFDGRVGG